MEKGPYCILGVEGISIILVERLAISHPFLQEVMKNSEFRLFTACLAFCVFIKAVNIQEAHREVRVGQVPSAKADQISCASLQLLFSGVLLESASCNDGAIESLPEGLQVLD